MSSADPTRARRTRAFTLFEVLGVILVTTLLMSVAVDFYIDLSRQANRASGFTRELRRATAILDRVAADLEHTILVGKPDEVDPLAHPWIFVAESIHAADGADRLMFVRRQTPRSTSGAASDLALVAYVLERSEDDESFALLRWSSPELPPSLVRDFPPPGDPDLLLLADGIESFGLRFLDPESGWVGDWDSSQLVRSSALPEAVEIEISLVGGRIGSDEFGEDAPQRYTRQVRLPLRPLDLALLLDRGEDEKDGEEDGDEDEDFGDLTLSDCDLSGVDKAAVAASQGISTAELDLIIAQYQDTPLADAPVDVRNIRGIDCP